MDLLYIHTIGKSLYQFSFSIVSGILIVIIIFAKFILYFFKFSSKGIIRLNCPWLTIETVILFELFIKII